MSYRKTRAHFAPITTVAAFAALSVWALPGAAAARQVAQAAGTTQAVNAENPVDAAARLAGEGKFVKARAMLLDAVKPGRSAALSDADRQRAYTLLQQVNRQLNAMDPMDASLQKAQLAVESGDLKLAQRHAEAVLKSPRAGAHQTAQAEAITSKARELQAAAAAAAPVAVQQALADFNAGRFSASKSTLDAVVRSGVDLSPSDQSAVDEHLARIVELERERGVSFQSEPVLLGVMQPGVVRRQQDQPAQPPAEPAPAPAPAPAPEPVAQPTMPPPAAEPAAQPFTPPPAPVTPPPSGDLTQEALRFEAQSLLAEADRAYTEKRWNEALNRLGRLRDEFRPQLSADELSRVEARIVEVRTQMRAQAGGGEITGVIADRAISKEQTVATFNSEMEQARQALSTGNTTAARDLLARARLTLNSRRDLFAEAEFENLLKSTDDLLAEVGVREEEIRRNVATQREQDLARQARESQRSQAEERERKINELIQRARAFQQEMRYDEALQAVDQLLFLDPINPAGLLLRDVIYDIKIYREFNQIQKQKFDGYVGQTIDNQRATIPTANIVDYPPDWPAISFRRGEPQAFLESASDRRVLAELENRRIPVEFKDNSLQDVVDFIAKVSNLNIDVDWDSLRDLPVEPSTTVSLRLNNASLKTVLDNVLSKVSPSGLGRASWAVSDGIVKIAADEVLRRNRVLSIYDISDLLIEVPDHVDAPSIDLQQAISSAQGGGGGGGGQGPFQDADQDNQLSREEIRERRDERIQQIREIITSNVDFENWQDNGGDTGMIQQLDNSLIITNTPRTHREIAGLLSKLREVRAMQINVETRFLLVRQDFFEQIGFDLDVYLNANNNQVRAARGQNPGTQPGDFFTDGQLNRVVSGPTTGAVDGEVPNLNQGVVNPRSWSPVGFEQNSLGLTTGLMPQTGIAGDVLQNAPALGIAGQFLDDIQVDFLVQATQADRRSISLTAPRLTFTNGQTSNIYVVTQQSFVSDLQPVVGESAVGFDPDVGVISEGVTMLVEGTVSADRRYVTMNVDAGVSRIDGFAQQAVSAVAGGQLVNSADTQSFIQLPRVTVTRVRTTVSVPDQGTILLGGQRLVTEIEVETGVPVLSKIPIINRFFTNRIESKEEQTLLILIKPTVIIQTEEENRNFPGLLDSMKAGFSG